LILSPDAVALNSELAPEHTERGRAVTGDGAAGIGFTATDMLSVDQQ
jgi:hypothetical protein